MRHVSSRANPVTRPPNNTFATSLRRPDLPFESPFSTAHCTAWHVLNGLLPTTYMMALLRSIQHSLRINMTICCTPRAPRTGTFLAQYNIACTGALGSWVSQMWRGPSLDLNSRLNLWQFLPIPEKAIQSRIVSQPSTLAIPFALIESFQSNSHRVAQACNAYIVLQPTSDVMRSVHLYEA